MAATKQNTLAKTLMTVQEAAQYLKLSDASIRSAISRNRLHYADERPYGRKVIKVAELDLYGRTARRGKTPVRATSTTGATA